MSKEKERIIKIIEKKMKSLKRFAGAKGILKELLEEIKNE
jgi:hypothetical protein